MPSSDDVECDDPSAPLLKTKSATIRDAALDLINGLGLLNATRRVPTFQWQPEDASACGVYLKRERKSALGDFNAGEPSFEVECVLGISVLTRVGDPDALEYATSVFCDPIERALLTNPEFLALFEGVISLERFSQFAGNGSAYMSDTRLELTVGFKETWAPDVPDDYRRTTMTTRPEGFGPDAPQLRTTIDVAQT